MVFCRPRRRPRTPTNSDAASIEPAIAAAKRTKIRIAAQSPSIAPSQEGRLLRGGASPARGPVPAATIAHNHGDAAVLPGRSKPLRCCGFRPEALCYKVPVGSHALALASRGADGRVNAGVTPILRTWRG